MLDCKSVELGLNEASARLQSPGLINMRSQALLSPGKDLVMGTTVPAFTQKVMEKTPMQDMHERCQGSLQRSNSGTLVVIRQVSPWKIPSCAEELAGSVISGQWCAE